MLKSPEYMALLFDYYGGVLNEKQAEIYRCYHGENLSLAEIAQDAGITRQGVHETLKRAEGILMKLEEELGLVARFREQANHISEMHTILNAITTLNKNELFSNVLTYHMDKIKTTLNKLVAD